MPVNGREVISRFDKLNNEAGNHKERWERMAPYIAPSRVGITTKNAPGVSQVRHVYDSTTMMAAELMAMFIAGHIINPSQRWFNFTTEDQVPPEIADPINEWNEECRDITLKRLSKSLFYAEGPESIIDYAGFGTGFLLCEENPQPSNQTLRGFRGFHFTAEKTGRFLIAEGPDGLVDTAFNEFELSARVMVDRWGRDNVSEAVKKAIDEGHQDRAFRIVHGIYPRPKAERSYGAKGMPWVSCWVEYESKNVCHESGYRVFPAAVPRYHRTPGEVFGRGRGDLAFPDTWTLNNAKRLGFEDWALKIRPPILHASDSVIGTLNLTPAGTMQVNTHGRPVKDVLAPFMTGSSPEVSQIKEEELRASIRQIFYIDHIIKLLETEKSEMTAYEFAKKIELLFRLMGPVYGRHELEYLHKIVDIMWDLQFYANAFPPPPPEIFQTSGNISIEFQNPIARAQRSGDAEALMLVMNDSAPLIQVFGPSVMDRLDPELAFEGLLNTRGVPARWQRSDEQISRLRAARAEQNAKEVQLADMEQMASAAGAAAPMMKVLQSQNGVKSA